MSARFGGFAAMAVVKFCPDGPANCANTSRPVLQITILTQIHTNCDTKYYTNDHVDTNTPTLSH